MKIVAIFANRLFAFHYDNEVDNEYDKNIELWTDSCSLLEFAKKYLKEVNLKQYVEDRLEDAEQIIDLIESISTDHTTKLDEFFRPLSDCEYVVSALSMQKGKIRQPKRRNDLRIYAIRIDEDCFVITGGAIKVSQKMQENELTQKELEKLKLCRQYLNYNGVFDNESFFELLNS
jgi:hypothetical protein